MGKWEHKIETHLFEQMENIGGTSRKWVCPGRVGVPDQIVFLEGFTCLVETKTMNGILNSKQIREQKRLTDKKIEVYNCWSEYQVDRFVEKLKTRFIEKEKS
jgi:hypothetical protein